MPLKRCHRELLSPALATLAGLVASAGIVAAQGANPKPMLLAVGAASTKPLSAAQAPVPKTTAPSRAEGAMLRSRERFQTAKRLLQEGDRDGARAAFDESISILEPVASDDRAGRMLEELIDLIHKYDIDELGAGTSRQAVERSPLDDLREANLPLDPKLRSLVQHQIAATSTEWPIEMNDAVLSFVNYFTTGRGRNTLINGWRRSHRYRPMIQRILAEEGVPQELIFLAQAESGFQARAVSYKAACGMWQFVAFRGKEYGLEQTPHMDLRLDPEKATRAAARHLRDLYMQFGDWALAIAAYNCGPGCVSRAVERTGYADYWELRRRNAIPKETTNYVPIISALTIVTKNAEDYGIDLSDPDPELQYDTITLDSPTNLELIADAADLPVSSIRELNPALLRTIAPAGYDLRLPVRRGNEIAAAIEMVPTAQRMAWRLHRYRSGETLAEIASRYRTAPKSILAVNAAETGDWSDGQTLIIPASYVEPPVRRAAATRTTAKRAVTTKARAAVAKKSTGRAKAGARTAARPQFKTAGRRASL